MNTINGLTADATKVVAPIYKSSMKFVNEHSMLVGIVLVIVAAIIYWYFNCSNSCHKKSVSELSTVALSPFALPVEAVKEVTKSVADAIGPAKLTDEVKTSIVKLAEGATKPETADPVVIAQATKTVEDALPAIPLVAAKSAISA